VTKAIRGTDPDIAGFERFVVEHYRRLIALAALVDGDTASAEDVVQTSLERAWRSRGSLRGTESLKPWLDRIVVREAARERRIRLRWLPRLVRPLAVTEIAAPIRDLEDQRAARFPERAAIRAVLAQLGPGHRAVVVLHLHAGYSVDETAEILGVPRETVRSRLRAARERLRVALGEVG
jgi:RNA polymerase sigma-70 factor (ECF subfamily)